MNTKTYAARETLTNIDSNSEQLRKALDEIAQTADSLLYGVDLGNYQLSHKAASTFRYIATVARKALHET
jgi:phage terminase large subunit-like protein